MRSISLLEICTDAIKDVKGYNVPTTIINNNDDDAAVQLLRAAKKVGRELVTKVRWQALDTEYTFSTVNGTEGYSLPSDYQNFVEDTFWDRSNDWQLLGPASPQQWQMLKSGIIAASTRFWFRISGNYVKLFPTPADAYTIAYNYYSRYYCATSVGVAQEDWAGDSDLSRIDGELMTLGVCYYFKKSEGLPFTEEKADYLAAIRDLKDDDAPKATIDLGASARTISRYVNIPEGSWS